MLGNPYTERPQRVVKRVAVALVATTALLIALAVVVSPALAYKEWQHATAIGKRSCAAGCHADQAPTNATCTGCHSGFTAPGGQACWTCHEPGQSTAAWQSAAGCTTTCHLWATASEDPSYSTPYAHGASIHLGASGYGRTCVDCHGVSLGATAPGTSPHHDAADGPAPSCRDCHDGVLASSPTGHESFGSTCSACHTGMDRPSGECAACHVGRTDTTVPQVVYTNTLACADAGCHGKVTSHAGTPIGAAPCTTCHAGHYASLAPCVTCHAEPQAFHHGTVAARPLADCAGCHDGVIASVKASHAGVTCVLCHTGMDAPVVPAVCSRCHFPRRFGTEVCTACHSPGGLTAREQVHAASPGAGVTCASCHGGHNADLGGCASCHGLVPEAHHGVASLSASRLTLRASAASLTAGAAGVVTGTLTDAGGAAQAGAELLFQERRLSATAFTDVATLTTGADGGFSRPVRPVAGTEYRVVYRGLWSSVQVPVHRPALATTTLRIVQRVTLRARPAPARVGTRVKLSGVATPTASQLGAARPAVALRVDRRIGGGWVTAASARLTPRSDGAFSWVWRPKKAGSYRVTASAAASVDLLAAGTRVVLRVR